MLPLALVDNIFMDRLVIHQLPSQKAGFWANKSDKAAVHKTGMRSQDGENKMTGIWNSVEDTGH